MTIYMVAFMLRLVPRPRQDRGLSVPLAPRSRKTSENPNESSIMSPPPSPSVQADAPPTMDLFALPGQESDYRVDDHILVRYAVV